MSEKPYLKVGKTYYPKTQEVEVTEAEVKGNWWQAWSEAGKYFYEFDEGHFASKLKKVEITNEDFQLLKSGKIFDVDLTRRYG